MEFQLQHQSFQLIFRADFLWDGLVGFPCSPRDSQESSPIPQFKTINSSMLSFIVQLSHPYMTTGKTIALTRRTFVGKVMSLLFNSTPRLPPNKGRSPHLASPGCPLLLLAPASQASQVTSLTSCLLPVSPSLTPPHHLGLLAGS